MVPCENITEMEPEFKEEVQKKIPEDGVDEISNCNETGRNLFVRRSARTKRPVVRYEVR